MAKVAVALFVGLALGVALGLFAAPAPEAAEAFAPSARLAEPPVEAATAAPDLSTPDREAREAPREEAHPELGRSDREGADELDPLSLALLQQAAKGLRAGWRERRGDRMPDALHAEGMRRFKEELLGLAAKIGREMADEESARERALADAMGGGAFELLAALAEDRTAVPALVTNGEAYGSLFRRTHDERTLRGEVSLGSLDEVLEDGVTLAFPAGVFELRRLLRQKRPFPDDVTLTGAGMNSTLFVLTSDWMPPGSVRRFEVRDCTVFTDDNTLVDQRQGELTMLLERVRVIGTDIAAGTGAVFTLSGKGGVLRARDCRFEAGYGRDPGHGQVFAFRTPAPVTARFERCTISKLSLTINPIQGGTTLVFDACRLDEMLVFRRESRLFEDPPPGLILASGTSVTTFKGTSDDVPRLDLNDLFPDWKARMQSR